ncbi:uncharacterized protein LOC129584345 [Paramacrobiotus metropolitanus]|uniref:uncharacterized protein LOC129584345 n=1 Tax=Paramacrobiotus metropolitanus TaxID=2943436 RepID=UPI0024457CBD|nr:uncharacterized protein LOC129584345 [Paramacrobiotus metropolitanus]
MMSRAISILVLLLSAGIPCLLVLAQNGQVHLFDTMVIVLPNSSNNARDVVLERIRQAYELSLRPEVEKVKIDLLIDSPFFTQKFTDDGSPYLFLDGLPKPLMRNGSLTNSRPVVITDSIEITATGRAQRDKIMEDIKQVWEKVAAAANISHLQVDIISDRPSEAYATSEGVPIRSITYRITATANTDFDELALKNEFRLHLNISAVRNLWKIPDFIIPAFDNNTTIPTTTTQPNFSGMSFSTPVLRNIVIRVSGQVSTGISVSEAKRRFRKVVAAFPVEGLWFISEEDAEAAAVDETVIEMPVNVSVVYVNVTEPCNYVCPNYTRPDDLSIVSVQNITAFSIVSNISLWDNVTEPTIPLTFINLAAPVIPVNITMPALPKEIPSSVPDYGSFLLMSNLIDTMGKLTEMSSRVFKRVFQI